MSFFVYVIQSEIDKSYYVGYTVDLETRLDKHNAGNSQYTSKKIPWVLVYFEEFQTKSDAIKREKFIKRQKSSAFIRRLIFEKNNT
ncbi:GIY-YIG nuclease family protein [Spongiivirga sp. MCCC 1A20706]|uniref:GIY-YIG nuclease family protein n=1 Tax=Spongiivirga sp. MCCC 1A20706 TaxID=3160963 RepID=UPI0039777988